MSNRAGKNGLQAVEQALGEAQAALAPESYGPPSTPVRIASTSDLVGKAVRDAVGATANELRKLVDEAEKDVAHAKSEIEALIKDLDKVVADHTGLIAGLLSNVKNIAESTAAHRTAMNLPMPAAAAVEKALTDHDETGFVEEGRPINAPWKALDVRP